MYMTFPTKAAAQAEIAKMRGWNAKAVKVEIAKEDNSGSGTKAAWAIQCGGTKYLRQDGYVR